MSDAYSGWVAAELELARNKADAAAQRHTYAISNGDYGGAAQAQRELARYEHQIVQLEATQDNWAAQQQGTARPGAGYDTVNHHRAARPVRRA
jgi:hypothetical protein